MARVNAMEEQFEEVEILGKPALFTPLRIERGTVPCGYHLYEVRHDDDCQGDAVQIARNIYVNHWGSLITLDEIDMPADGFLDIEPDDMNYGAGKCCTMREFMKQYPAKSNYIDKCECYIHSLKKGGQSQLAEATIIEKIGDNLYLADYNGVRCTAIFNPFVCRYYVDDLNGLNVPTEALAFGGNRI